MISLIDSQLALFEDAAIPREGLPFWILYALLLIILLLLVFIFLKEKELRQRLDFFFFKARKKVTKLRLLRKLRKQRRNKLSLYQKLGERVWKEGIRPDGAEAVCADILSLEIEIELNQKEIERVDSEINMLSKKEREYRHHQEVLIGEQESGRKPHEERMIELTRRQVHLENHLSHLRKDAGNKEKEKKALERKLQKIDSDRKLAEEERGAKREELDREKENLMKRKEDAGKKTLGIEEERSAIEKEKKEAQLIIDVFNQKRRALQEEERQRVKEFEREIREWQRAKENIQKKKAGIESQKLPCYESLGKLVDKARVESEGFVPLYSQIDRIDKRLQDLKARIEDLGV